MSAHISTFRARRASVDRPALSAALEHAGFDVDAPAMTSRTVLDTFDGRLAEKGLRLEMTVTSRSGPHELLLSGGAGAPARVSVASTPRTADDLPPGPMRARLARLLDVRVLIPLLTVSSQQTNATRRNRAGKSTVLVVAHDDPAVDGTTIADRLVDVVELVGYPKPAAEARALIEQLGWRETDGGVIELAAAAAGIDLAGQHVTPGVPLAEQTPALDGFRAVLANLRDAIVVNWNGTIDDVDSEFLHDLRVAVRRTRSVLANAKAVIPGDVRDGAREEFAWLGEITGPARDLDVYQLEWEEYTAPLGSDTAAALEPVRRYLDDQRADAHGVLAAQLGDDRARSIVEHWSEWLDRPAPATDEADAATPIGSLIARRIRRAHKKMLRRGRTITTATPAEVLHELRKDAKKLRYLLECFGGLYEPEPRKAFVQRLKALQDNLGMHQDAEVHAHHLRELSDTLAPTATTEAMLATGRLIERLEQRRLACRTEFADRFATFDSAKTAAALDAVLASTVTDAAGPA